MFKACPALGTGLSITGTIRSWCGSPHPRLLDHPGPIGLRSPVHHCHPAPSFQRSEQHEKVAHPLALVFVGARRPRPGRTRPARLFHSRSWPRAGSAVCWSRPDIPELRCPHTGDGRPPARLPSRRRTRAQTNSALPCGGMHQHSPAFLQPEPAPLQNGGLSSFFQRLAHRFRANALYYLAFDQPVGQQFQRPTGPAFRRFSAGQGNQSLPRTGYGWASP